MKSVIADLRDKLRDEMPGQDPTQEVFDLLLAACSACCSKFTGGNETCPPKVEAAGA